MFETLKKNLVNILLKVMQYMQLLQLLEHKTSIVQQEISAASKTQRPSHSLTDLVTQLDLELAVTHH